MDYNAITIDTYNRQAANAARKFYELTGELYRRPLLGFRDLLSPGAHILDVGCGPGNVEALLLEDERAYQITGIDLSSELLNIARVRTPSVQYVLGDIRKLPLSMNAYDAVIASFCLPHLTDDEAMKLLADIAQLLKPGGLFYLSTMAGEGSTCEAASFSQGDMLFYNFYSEDLLREALARNGLEVLQVLQQDYPELDGSVTVDLFIYARKRAYIW